MKYQANRGSKRKLVKNKIAYRVASEQLKKDKIKQVLVATTPEG
jgi:hypothetical protein